MKLRPLLLALSCFAALSRSSTAAETAATVVSGTLLGHDGKPLAKGEAHLVRPQQEKPLLSVTVASPHLTNVATGAVVQGVRKGGHYVFSGLGPGTYREA